MDVLTSSNNKAEQFIARLAHDFPEYKFVPGAQEHWSPRRQTITYKPEHSLKELRYGVLHELAHARLGHKDYQSDFELLIMEAEAWELAAKLGRKYGVRISEDHIQNCLDTYRDWLHRRSACPSCGLHVLQQDAGSYHCFNCQTDWKVSSGRFVRAYRLRKNREQ